MAPSLEQFVGRVGRNSRQHTAAEPKIHDKKEVSES
jgi:hypothetical protein